MTKLTIDLDNYSKDDQELIQAIWRKFKPTEQDISCPCGGECHKCSPKFLSKEVKDKYFRGWDISIDDPIWKPEEDEIYWHVEVYGTVRDERYYNNVGTSSKSFDVIQYEKGNVFKTKEAAQRMADRRKRIGIFENKMMEFADWVEYSSKYSQVGSGFYISYDPFAKQWLYFESTPIKSPLQIYMTKENAEKAVEWANKYYPEGL